MLTCSKCGGKRKKNKSGLCRACCIKNCQANYYNNVTKLGRKLVKEMKGDKVNE